MTQSQAKELFIIIRNWCYQQYNEKVAPGLPPKEYGTRIFELLPKYKESFPQSCFYTGIIYRKMKKGSNCPKQLVACSYEKGTNTNISMISCPNPRYYQSTCKEGYILHNILLYLKETFSLNKENSPGIENALERTESETEVICYMEQKNFQKEK